MPSDDYSVRTNRDPGIDVMHRGTAGWDTLPGMDAKWVNPDRPDSRSHTYSLESPSPQRKGKSMTLALILLLIAVILFGIAAFGVDGGRINLTAAGLAFFACSFLVGLV